MKTDTALIIIDMQTALVDGTNPVYQLDTLLKNISTLITLARTTGTPIIYIQDNDEAQQYPNNHQGKNKC